MAPTTRHVVCRIFQQQAGCPKLAQVNVPRLFRAGAMRKTSRPLHSSRYSTGTNGLTTVTVS